ncbi:MAG: hypothetical protein R2856_15375 [Caldilineaceae bacterium]
MRTVFWEDNRVKMIDQRLLPGEFVIAEFDSVDGVARSITEMYVRGALPPSALPALTAWRWSAGERSVLTR